jgi:hypothetical protein
MKRRVHTVTKTYKDKLPVGISYREFKRCPRCTNLLWTEPILTDEGTYSYHYGHDIVCPVGHRFLVEKDRIILGPGLNVMHREEVTKE